MTCEAGTTRAAQLKAPQTICSSPVRNIVKKRYSRRCSGPRPGFIVIMQVGTCFCSDLTWQVKFKSISSKLNKIHSCLLNLLEFFLKIHSVYSKFTQFTQISLNSLKIHSTYSNFTQKSADLSKRNAMSGRCDRRSRPA